MIENYPIPADPIQQSLTSPETRLRQAIQDYQVQHPKARAIDIAHELECSESEALAALSTLVFNLPATALTEVLAEIKSWQYVLVLVRNQHAIAELTVPADAWHIKRDWLNWTDVPYNLHINLTATEQILGLVRVGKNGPTHSFNLINQQGDAFCRFYTRTPSAKDRFLTFCQSYNLGKK